ncbi:MAG: competence/damage-inducible protein A [Lachnospiraceae bacterium]|nr:competence/damage-inducible protein A [Lachnospiraceae bacterium]
MGNIVNTNASFLARECASLGLSSYYQTTVGDNEKRLLALIERARERSDILIFSGGLGPTEDDLTKETVAKACGRKMVVDKPSRDWIEKLLKDWGRTPTENNWKQAEIPEGADALPNANGTAPGIYLEDKGTHFFLLPGPPGELIPMFQQQVKPILQKLSGRVFYSAMVKIQGIGESKVENDLKDLIDAQTNPTIATYADAGVVKIRVTAGAKTEKKAKEKTGPVVQEIKKRFGNAVFTSKEEVSLEEAVVKLLKKKKFTLALAESCTGGLVAGQIVNVPGASEVFLTGAVTYSEASKQAWLGVSEKTLKKHGAVSEKCAMEMAEGARKRFQTDCALSTTGFAGPEGGTKENPVGTVYFGVSIGKKSYVKKRHFNGNRERVRTQATAWALGFLRRCLLET